jgi:Activator of Hsp90 ATPase homolog 1-like protein
MDEEHIEVTRWIELDLEPDVVWDVIGVGERWADWMVDVSALEVAPGSTGHVVDAGERREVRIDEIVVGARVAFEWWPAGRPDQASSVELRIVHVPRRTVLEVVETFPARRALSASVATSRWVLRAQHLSAGRRLLVAA